MLIPELLAPVGNYESLEAVVGAGANAVYLGGKELNMRIRRPGYNFALEELEELLPLLKAKKIKVYFTLNSLVNQNQLSKAAKFLEFLEVQRIDGVIVQDLGIIQLAKKVAPSLPLHASTQVNIHNSLGARILEDLGIRRVVLARELNLKEIQAIRQQTKLELEFFIYGSRCISYSGQCYLSSALGGGGGNQGLCSKPCRLLYNFPQAGADDYYLSPKDTSLLTCLPELLARGIGSFKIEGRMEDKEHLKEIVGLFRQAIDNYLEKPRQYSNNLEEEKLLSLTRRQLTTGYLRGRPGKSYFQLRGTQEEEEKYFHQAFAPASQPRMSKLSFSVQREGPAKKSTFLAVWVKDLEGLQAAQKADMFYLGGEHMRSWGERPVWWFKHEKYLQELREKGKKIYLALPNIAKEDDLAVLETFLAKFTLNQWDGMLVGSLGTLALAYRQSQLPICLDLNFNIFNGKALELLNDYNLERFCFHPEGEYFWTEDQPCTKEAVIWGFYPGMVLENCLLEDFLACPCSGEKINLKALGGRILRIEADLSCRNHLFPRKRLNLIRQIPELQKMGVEVLRIDGRWLKPKRIRELVEICHRKLGGRD